MWAKLDDRFPDHPKLGRLDPFIRPFAFELHVTAICYCARELTDGSIPHGQVRRLADFSAHEVSLQDLVDALVDVGLWEASDGFYQIHDFTDYNPTRAQVEEQRATKSRAGKKGAQEMWAKRRRAPSDGTCHDTSNGTSHSKSMADECPVPVPGPDPGSPDSQETVPAPLAREVAALMKSADGRFGQESARLLVEEFGERVAVEATRQALLKESSGQAIHSFPAFVRSVAERLKTDGWSPAQASDADEHYEWGDPRETVPARVQLEGASPGGFR